MGDKTTHSKRQDLIPSLHGGSRQNEVTGNGRTKPTSQTDSDKKYYSPHEARNGQGQMGMQGKTRQLVI